MKKILSIVAFGCMSLALNAVSASAGLIGSTIFLSQRYPDSTTILQSFPVTVQAGTGDQNIFGSIYTSNPEDNSISINFFRPFTFEAVPFNGHAGEFIPEPIQSVSVDTNIQGWDNSRLSYTNSSFAFNWSGLSVAQNTYFNAQLDFKAPDAGQTTVPEPATMLLFGAGIAPLLFRKSMRKFSK